MENMQKQKILVIGGAGYVGLATSIGMAITGSHVISYDIDEEKIKKLQNGLSPFYEEGVVDALKRLKGKQSLIFTSSLSKKDIQNVDVIFVTVATPALNNGKSDFFQIKKVFSFLKDKVLSSQVIVIKSTLPLGGMNIIQEIMKPKIIGKHYYIAYNPEFLREATALNDFINPQRIVVGTNSSKVKLILQNTFDYWIKKNIPYIQTDINSAQLIKYASNAYLASRISFINEIASLSEKFNANITSIIKGMGYDSRIGHHYLSPGLGFGGPCLEKDIKALIQSSVERGYNPQLLKAILSKNADQIALTISKLHESLENSLNNKKIAVWGLSFKKDSDDIRDSLALRVVERLIEDGVTVAVYDPMAMRQTKKIYPSIHVCKDAYKTAEKASAILLLTDWDEFANYNFSRIKKSMISPIIIDTKNLLSRSKLESLGYKYFGFGQ